MICRRKCLVLVKKEGPASVQIYALLHDRRHPSTSKLFFDPCLARSAGLGPIWSPTLRASPIEPSAACHCQSTSPNWSQSASSTDQITSKSPILTEALEGAMDSRVVAIDFGDLIPLSACAEVVNEPVQDRPCRGSLAPPGSWRIKSVKQPLDAAPEIVRQGPEC